MRHYDIVIVGAGITGCAITRQLSRYDLAIACVEAGNDIALGSTKANGGLVHAGYDPAAGTVKASVNARGCALYGRWAKELGFGFKRTGSMVLGFSPADREHLEKLLENGRANGVEDMRIIEDDEIWEHEPRASKEATCALWCPSTGYVDPFEVAIAAAENAAANGVEFWRSAAVDAIDEHADGFVLHTSAGDLSASYLVNAAGNGCADISRMAGGEHFELVWRQGNIAVLDHEARPLMPLYPIPTSVSKGVIVTGTVHGNTVITATAAIREAGDNDTYAADVEELLSGARKLVPDLDTRRLVRAFAGGRAVIRGLNDFLIERSAAQPRLFQAAGIQSPGVASAPAVAERIEGLIRQAGITLIEKPGYNPAPCRRISTSPRPIASENSSSPTLPGGAWCAAAKPCRRLRLSPRSAASREPSRSKASSAVAAPGWEGAKAVFARAVWCASSPANSTAIPPTSFLRTRVRTSSTAL